MNADEREIYHYVKSRKQEFLSARDIAQHAGDKRMRRANPGWAAPVLLHMVERGILETNDVGGYQLKPIPKKDTLGKRWASPEIAEMLRKSGKALDSVIRVEDEDQYYEAL